MNQSPGVMNLFILLVLLRLKFGQLHHVLPHGLGHLLGQGLQPLKLLA